MKAEHHLRSILVAIALAFFATAAFARYVPDEIIVVTKPGKEANVERKAKSQGMATEKTVKEIRLKVLKLPKHVTVEKAIAELKDNPDVEYVGPNHRIHVVEVPQVWPNDPVFFYGDELLGMPQWGLYNDGDNNGYGGGYRCDIHAPEAWAITTGSPDIIIANIDTGVDYTHEDLTAKVISPGYNAIDGSSNVMDDHGHGTFTAGVSAASTNDWTGMAGVSWGSPILPVKVLDAEGYGDEADAADGIVWAVNHGAKVLNMSFATDINDPANGLEAAIEYAWSHGSISVCASGNENVNTPMYPAAYTHALAVGASNEFDQRCTSYDWGSGGSNYGSYLDVMAPGSYITSAAIDTLFGGQGYWPESGTSAAAPFVTGVAALVWSVNPTWTNEQVLNQIKQTCDDIGASGWDIETGYGRVNAYKAVSSIPQTVSSLGRLSDMTDGTIVTCPEAVITAGSGHLSDRIYIEHPDRFCGIAARFSGSIPSELAIGSRVQINGRLSIVDGERTLSDASVSNITAGTPLIPLGMQHKSLGGTALKNNPGVTGGKGLNNIGLLVRVAGKVTATTSSAYTYFYVDDGSGLDDGSGITGLRVECGTLTKPAKDKIVSVTGISSVRMLPDKSYAPVLRVRMQNDIKIN